MLSTQTPLAALLLAQLQPPRTAGQGELALELEQLLASLLEEARQAWPKVELSDEAFLRGLAERISAGEPLAPALRDLHGSDLYLAVACAAGRPQALACFERQLLSQVPLYVAAIDSSVAFADEVAQLLRTKLFVGDGAAGPKIRQYGGRGPLGGWLRVAAIRTARNLKRGPRPISLSPEELGRKSKPAPDPDPELSYLKAHYGREFRDAFEATLAGLPERRRNVLRLYYLEQLSSVAIAKLYQVTGAAVRLWLKQAREEILTETRRLLGERLGLGAAELDSVIGLVQSRFELSMSRILKGPIP